MSCTFCSPWNMAFRKLISNSLLNSEPKRRLKPKSVCGLMYFSAIMLHLLFNQQIYGIFDNYPTVMPVFLLFEMFYFQQFLTYQVCGLLSRLPVKSSTLWWNQQYEQVLNIGEICSLLYLSIIVLYFILFSLLCGILDNGEYGYTLYEIIKYSLGYNIILCRYTLFSVEFSSFAI